MDSEQRDKTERVDESYRQVHVNKCRCGVRRFKETWVRTIRIIAPVTATGEMAARDIRRRMAFHLDRSGPPESPCRNLHSCRIVN
jgi:hypothetical protein